jgi:hypothetical protein
MSLAGVAQSVRQIGEANRPAIGEPNMDNSLVRIRNTHNANARLVDLARWWRCVRLLRQRWCCKWRRWQQAAQRREVIGRAVRVITTLPSKGSDPFLHRGQHMLQMQMQTHAQCC